MENKPILITASMEKEYNKILDLMNNVKEETFLDYRIFRGEINKYPVILLETKIGLVNSAISTTHVVEKYLPCIIVNEGTAGSHEYNYHRFDIVIGNSVVNINSIKTNVAQLGRGVNPLSWEIKEFLEGVTETIYYESDELLLELAESLSDKYRYGKTYVGKIGSGDIWNREIDRIKWLNKTLKTSCEEMEAVSIYKIAQKFKIPVISLKIISNNELYGEKYDDTTVGAIQEFTIDYIKEFINLNK